MPKAAPTHRPMPHLAPVHRVESPDEAYGQGRGGRPWRRKRDEVLRRDGYLCKCDDCVAENRLLIAHEVDHIVPKAEGGTDDPSNLRAINRDCHRAKSAKERARGANRSHSGRRRTQGEVSK